MVYFPTFGLFFMGFHVGKYTSPMDAMDGLVYVYIYMVISYLTWVVFFNKQIAYPQGKGVVEGKRMNHMYP